jgi:hypothetical protein
MFNPLPLQGLHLASGKMMAVFFVQYEQSSRAPYPGGPNVSLGSKRAFGFSARMFPEARCEYAGRCPHTPWRRLSPGLQFTICVPSSRQIEGRTLTRARTMQILMRSHKSQQGTRQRRSPTIMTGISRRRQSTEPLRHIRTIMQTDS